MFTGYQGFDPLVAMGRRADEIAVFGNLRWSEPTKTLFVEYNAYFFSLRVVGRI